MAVHYYTQNQQPPALEKSVSNTYHWSYQYIYQCPKQLEQLVKLMSIKYRLRCKVIVRENTGSQQSATNKKKMHTHLKSTDKKQLHRTKHDHINNMWTYPITGPMIYYQKREPVCMYALCTAHAMPKLNVQWRNTHQSSRRT